MEQKGHGWTYGVRKTGTLVRVSHNETSTVLVVAGDDRWDYIVFQNPKLPIPEVGSRVTLESAEGGSTGGHWRIVNDPLNPAAD